MTGPPAKPGASSFWPHVLLIAGALAAVRLAYLVWLCPYTLIEDEAHYWEWSRRLDWSYYSKGPGIALAISAATHLFGTSEASIRAVAVVSSLVSTLAVAGLAGSITRGNRRLTLFAVGAFLLAPMNQLLALLSTIDGPYLACWALACWAAHRALDRSSRAAWPLLGISLGVGFLFKYTILLLIPGLLLYALVRRKELRAARQWPLLAIGAAILASLGVLPVVIWNSQHGWPTVHHLLGHINAAGGDIQPAVDSATYHPAWTLEFIGTQFALVGPLLALCLCRSRRPHPSNPAPGIDRGGRTFLTCCAAPILIFYLVVTFFAEAEGNWALGAYVTLLPLAGLLAADALHDVKIRTDAWRAIPPPRPWSGFLRRRPESIAQVLWHAAIVYGVVVAICTPRLDLLARLPSIGPLIPMGRLTGADRMAAHASRLADSLRAETGKQPFYMAAHYGRASLLAFYLPGRPVVYSTSSLMEGRRTQYDLWPDTDLRSDAINRDLAGRPAVVCGALQEQWEHGFDTVRTIEGTGTEPPPARDPDNTSRLDGEGKKGRLTFVALGFHGFVARRSTSPMEDAR